MEKKDVIKDGLYYAVGYKYLLQTGGGGDKMKKLLAIGIAAILMMIILTPASIAEKEAEGEESPIETQSYGLALIKGKIQDPYSIYPFLNIINKFLGYKFMITANFTEGTIEPRFKIFNLRNITLPKEGYSHAVITVSFANWQLNPIEGSPGEYEINGTASAIWLVATLVPN